MSLSEAIVGKPAVLDLALTALLCEGHLLIEDVPGVGKTTLARSLAHSIGAEFRRIQCTPDLLPADITGVSIFDQKLRDFVFRPGPVFTNVLLADEINRATPRTQSSLLECMEEQQVTGDGETRPLPRPFLVIATQNPVELEGTFPLPEAQLDRFLIRISLGYPSEAEEELILREHSVREAQIVTRVVSASELVMLQRICRDVYVEPSVRRYVVALSRATREHRAVELGASPRGTLALYHASQAWAALRGRAYVLPDDVKAVSGPTLGHRLVLTPEARIRGRGARGVIEDVLSSVPVPVEAAEVV
ncbi:MAG: MoxR family ATPase [Chloroflexi bacterium]|nr:MoxR family ATPase [Chloroflexota bacterium]